MLSPRNYLRKDSDNMYISQIIQTGVTWQTAYVTSIIAVLLSISYLAADRIRYMIKRQPVYKLINSPNLAKETIADCYKGKNISEQESLYFNIVTCVTMLSISIAVSLILLRNACIETGINASEINNMTITQMLTIFYH